VDPIEKKPLNHFLPGSPVLSFGTAGCNLGCRFCQNWDISRSRETDTLADEASPQAIAQAAAELGCRSVAFTYNDPVIFMEYAIDVADACRERGIKAVAVTAGYMSAGPRAEFYRHIDAANVDLRGSPVTSTTGCAWESWTRYWRPCCTSGTRPACGWRSPAC
jgi:pyruvate formate lyase activating enzyme